MQMLVDGGVRQSSKKFFVRNCTIILLEIIWNVLICTQGQIWTFHAIPIKIIFLSLILYPPTQPLHWDGGCQTWFFCANEPLFTAYFRGGCAQLPCNHHCRGDCMQPQEVCMQPPFVVGQSPFNFLERGNLWNTLWNGCCTGDVCNPSEMGVACNPPKKCQHKGLPFGRE